MDTIELGRTWGQLLPDGGTITGRVTVQSGRVVLLSVRTGATGVGGETRHRHTLSPKTARAIAVQLIAAAERTE